MLEACGWRSKAKATEAALLQERMTRLAHQVGEMMMGSSPRPHNWPGVETPTDGGGGWGRQHQLDSCSKSLSTESRASEQTLRLPC